MPSPIPYAIKQESVILGAQGIKLQDIALTLNISVDTVCQVANRVGKQGCYR
jgi:hypothetical protein